MAFYKSFFLSKFTSKFKLFKIYYEAVMAEDMTTDDVDEEGGRNETKQCKGSQKSTEVTITY